MGIERFDSTGLDDAVSLCEGDSLSWDREDCSLCTPTSDKFARHGHPEPPVSSAAPERYEMPPYRFAEDFKRF
ncbi:hypothetical protein E2C01_091848 [Portunus trituberculatus]|uniref:Uncharacterized protein n=1 Tax=Portunus trituberculatus TaxID=210409 RepID=A0A5B7JK42_PORTR|nr:hypothetical protein [Portunus trituberculatus]